MRLRVAAAVLRVPAVEHRLEVVDEQRQRRAVDVHVDLEAIAREDVAPATPELLVRPRRDERELREDGDVDQPLVVAVDEDRVWIRASAAEVPAAEALERIEVLDLAQRDDVGARLLEGFAGDGLGLVGEADEVFAVDRPAVLDRLRRIDVAVELEACEQILDVERGDPYARHFRHPPDGDRSNVRRSRGSVNCRLARR